MNNSSNSNRKPDAAQLDADQVTAAMENDVPSSNQLSQSEKETRLLGQAIRRSTRDSLPEPNEDLRDLISETIEESIPTVAPSKPAHAGQTNSKRWLVAATTVAAILIFGSIGYLAMMPEPQGVNLASGPTISGTLDTSALEPTTEVGDPVESKTNFNAEPASKKLRKIDPPANGLGGQASSVVKTKPSAEVQPKRESKSGQAQSPIVKGSASGSGEKNSSESSDSQVFQRSGSAVSRSGKGKAMPATAGMQPPRSLITSYKTELQERSKFKAIDPKVSQETGSKWYEYGRSNEPLASEESGREIGSSFGIGNNQSKGFANNTFDGGEYHEGRFEDRFQRGARFRRGGQGGSGFAAEQYDNIHENTFKPTEGQLALSTFSIDVDTASYANMRRFLGRGQRVPPNAVRIEEFINYFNYDYPQPDGDTPFSVNMELATCPWNEKHKLLRVGLKGKEIHRDERPAANIVFLIDVSGSMRSNDKLPLLKSGFQLMVNALNENDSVSIVTYAGNSRVVLAPTSGDQKQLINQAINNLQSGGSTNGSAGIEKAYQLAQENFIKDGNNKVILATDGDLNVGVTSDSDLVQLISTKASEGVFLTVLGFGTGNLKDSKMEKIADNGNGIYAYIDGVREAHKVLVEGMSGSLVTIAKDVKIQIEFNPGEVEAYRLIGYENRILAAKDFDDDTKDAGEIGAGHTVTALYELVTKDSPAAVTEIPQGLKYQQPKTKPALDTELSEDAGSGELLTLALRYKQPESDESERIEFTLANKDNRFSTASGDFKFAASVAAFGMILRGSKYCGNATPQWIQETASQAVGADPGGYRAEFIDLVRRFHSAR